MSYAGVMDAPLFGNQAAPRIATREQKRAELERELKLRRHVYPARVGTGRMRAEAAARQIWLLEQVLADYV